MWTYNYAPELYHHGVLGMKWGVHRRRDDASSKSVGWRHSKPVEDAKQNLKEKKKAYNNSSIFEYEKASKDLQYAQEDLVNAKIKAKMGAKSHKSKHQEKLEAKYQEEGFTKEEAALAAYKRIRTEKILGVVAGLTIAAAAAYVGYNHYENNVDKLIKSGTTLQNISANSNKPIKDAFYASTNAIDDVKYRGIYGDQLSRIKNSPIFETKIKLNQDLRLASRKTATETLGDLVKSDERFKDDLWFRLRLNLTGNESQSKALRKAADKLKSGTVDSDVYEGFNILLSDHKNAEAKDHAKRFYDALTKKGYSAIKDVNDSKYSGYKSLNPLIVFNNGGKAAVDSVREVGKQEIQKNYNKAYGRIILRDLVTTGAAIATPIVAAKSALTMNTLRSNNTYVSNYRKIHPDTTLTYDQIIRTKKGKEKIKKV